MKYLNGRLLFALLFVVVFALLIWTATGYNQTARTMPLVVGIPVLLGALANLIMEVRAVQRGEKPKKEKTHVPAITVQAKDQIPAVARKEKVAVAAPALEMATAGGAPAPLTSVNPSAVPIHIPTSSKEVVTASKVKLSGKARARRELIGAAWIIGYVAAIWLIGFPVATVGYLVGFLRFYAHESWKLTIIYTVLLFGFIWIAFVFFLKSNLYWGMIFDWLGW
ncbi:MAG TPA: hypothetical protein VF932_19270 [Anaerolineae bacterium]